MTPKERVIRAVRHQTTDIIPYTIDMLGEVRSALTELYPEIAESYTNHLVFMQPDGFPLAREVEKDIFSDHFGVIWNKSVDKGCGVVVGTLIDKDNFDDFVFPDPTDPVLYRHFPDFLERNNDLFIIGALSMSYFERAWTLYGMENLLIAMTEDEGFVYKLLEGILDYNLKLIGEYAKFDEIDCIHINDDYGQQTNLIMGPRLWRKFFKPGLKIMADKIKSAGKFVYLHSCGNISEIIPDLIEVGIDIVNPLQPEVMDVFALKREYGKNITFHGGVSEQRTLNFGTPDDVEHEIREKIKLLGEGGGYILAPSQCMTARVPVENAARFIQVATNQ